MLRVNKGFSDISSSYIQTRSVYEYVKKKRKICIYLQSYESCKYIC